MVEKVAVVEECFHCGVKTKSPQIPITIEGIAASKSITEVKNFDTLPLAMNSIKYAVAIEIGTAITSPRSEIRNEP